MAESFYKFLHPNNDVISTRTLLHEAIPMTGTIVSGTYNDENIKNYTHGMFQSVYDYPYLSSSANHIFDITVGVSSKSSLYSSMTSQKTKKRNIYNQMAQVLVGYDHTGSVLRFDDLGKPAETNEASKMNEIISIPFSRILMKDEIKKGTFELKLGVSGSYNTPFNMVSSSMITITDYSGSDGYFENSPAGEYGVLYATGSSLASSKVDENGYAKCGLLYYQAGICILSASVLGGLVGPTAPGLSGSEGAIDRGMDALLTGSNIQVIADNFRHRLYNLQKNNTVELYSTVYFCRLNHNEFNYSTNPTYLNESKIRIKTKATDDPIAYVTTVGLYNDNNELLAVAKTSEPLKKTRNNELTIRVRLDF